jgi:ABC-2 type transport system permease protein/lipopolysaccharide transport system permease protein
MAFIRGVARLFAPELDVKSWQSRYWQLALDDVLSGLLRWPLWTRLGWNDILKRYRGSVLGPFWITASNGIMVVALGLLYANLFKTPVDDFLPFLCVGLLVWNLISGFLTEGGSLFFGAASFIKQVRMPYSVYVYQAAWSKLIIFAHNLVIYVGVLVYFRIWPGVEALLSLPGLLLVLINGAFSTLAIGIVSARFRDIPQIVSSIVQVLFFVTPIIWKPELLGDHWLLQLNPFYHLVEIVRSPLLGASPTVLNYGVVLLATLVNLAISGAIFVRFRSRIAYWV